MSKEVEKRDEKAKENMLEKFTALFVEMKKRGYNLSTDANNNLPITITDYDLQDFRIW